MYSVMFVDDEALPAGHTWALVSDAEGNFYAFIKRSHVTPHTLEQAWAGFRKIARHRLSIVA